MELEPRARRFPGKVAWGINGEASAGWDRGQGLDGGSDPVGPSHGRISPWAPGGRSEGKRGSGCSATVRGSRQPWEEGDPR